MCQSFSCCGPHYGTQPALREKRMVEAGKNILCIKCRDVNTCSNENHKHVYLGHTVRVPRKNASEYRWKEFYKIFSQLNPKN